MTTKRVFDLALACLLSALFAPLMLVLCVLAVLYDGRPFIYRSVRMKSARRKFRLYKIRTMSVVHERYNRGVTSGYKSARITQLGFFLRKSRLDELPQVINVIKGDISFVGPRPPEPRYVRARPDLYHQVLQDRPGITGLASVVIHRYEEWLLSKCYCPQETEEVYLRRSVPRKARIDLLYQKHKSIRLDLYILYLTAAMFVPLPGRRAGRVYRRLQWGPQLTRATVKRTREMRQTSTACAD
ncbi:Sugar transferase involved in LPS biosynthesis (colanic, teichoic acid) [Aliiroseovarius crassostreae]|uniref:sugar transferase n=1 Tax=Aliiroseovarius crassostreae TaxID=154981 RepID=UPI0008E01AB5|nr:sugar transferase [Aliiroseovarius crassostreae]SFU49042.1 Sugar transferase involved in LPS biosynthesis (colanic, teichoic acid) [Aliiroseovarius crassostreae]